MLALKSYDLVSSVNPDGSRNVFMGCPCGVVPEYENDYDDDWRNGYEGVDEHEDEWAEYRRRWS